MVQCLLGVAKPHIDTHIEPLHVKLHIPHVVEVGNGVVLPHIKKGAVEHAVFLIHVGEFGYRRGNLFPRHIQAGHFLKRLSHHADRFAPVAEITLYKRHHIQVVYINKVGVYADDLFHLAGILHRLAAVAQITVGHGEVSQTFELVLTMIPFARHGKSACIIPVGAGIVGKPIWTLPSMV